MTDSASAGSASRSRYPARIRAARAALLDERASSLLKGVRDIFCEPTRAQIVRALSTSPLRVSDLAQLLGRSKTVASRHLRVLREEGLVSRRRQGRSVFYSLSADPAVRCAVEALATVARVAA